jgi:hypothetical protein
MLFNSPFDNEPVRFAFTVEPPDDKHPDRFYYHLRIPVLAQQTGTFEIDPIELKGNIISGVDEQSQRVRLQKVRAASTPFSLTIKEPPLDGRPVSYVGVSATNLAVTASLDAQTCTVGSPLKLTLTITGTDNPASIYTPQLAKIVNIQRNFRVYDDVVETSTLDDGRRFVYTLRPVEAGTLEIPAIPVSYYNYELNLYETVATDPLPVRAIPVTQLSDDDIVGEMPTSIKIDTNGSGLLSRAAPLIFPVPATPQPIISPFPHLILVLTGPIVFVFIFLARALIQRHPHRQAAIRRAQAATHARHKLYHAELAPASRVVDAIRHFMADRNDLQTSSATPAEILEMAKRHMPETVATELARHFETAFNAAFSGHEDEIDQPYIDQVADLIHQAQHKTESEVPS